MNPPAPIFDPATSAGWIDRTDRERLRVSGLDRAKFLHNLTTNDVKRLKAGHGQESFVTSPQGKTLGYVTILADDNSLLVRGDPGGLAGVLPHLTKYGIFDDVALDDLGSTSFEFHLFGEGTEEILTALGATLPSLDVLGNATTSLADDEVWLVRESPTGFAGITVIGKIGEAGAVAESLRSQGLLTIPAEMFEAWRIEAGTPVYGSDVVPENLPQEIDRDAQAISFVKGCYLGQETVARLDALGHVNKILRRVRLEGTEAPPPGTPLELNGKRVGVITSSALSVGTGGVVALAMVRVAHASPESKLLAFIPDGPPLAAEIVAAMDGLAPAETDDA